MLNLLYALSVVMQKLLGKDVCLLQKKPFATSKTPTDKKKQYCAVFHFFLTSPVLILIDVFIKHKIITKSSIAIKLNE